MIEIEIRMVNGRELDGGTELLYQAAIVGTSFKRTAKTGDAAIGRLVADYPSALELKIIWATPQVSREERSNDTRTT